MPDNKNPSVNGKLNKPRRKKEKISRVAEAIECKHPDCEKWALSLSDYCWEHIEDKEGYREKIEEWVWEEKSMERFILIGVDLSGAGLGRAKLSGAKLEGANLSGAELGGAKLIDARVNWAKLTGVRGLTRENFSKELTEEEKKNAGGYKESYLTVKNYFIQNGLYDDASWAAFRERTLERIALAQEIWEEGLKGLSWSWWKSSFRWFGSKVISLLNGYGERPLRAVVSSGAIVVLFSIIHFLFNWIQANPPEELHWWDYLYFSIVTFTTLGYGDIRPLAAPGARMVASLEAFIGAFMIALFVWTLARRYVAR
ncbi:MAG: ion channel [Acidobacteriota bacterium]